MCFTENINNYKRIICVPEIVYKYVVEKIGALFIELKGKL